ncbi:MAG: ATP-dependent RNA helicase HrpA [Kiritimatiellae bacterium]|nr:ATP-dependent RNA helicase HrpA [Kiritimatiellia bacterium]
MTDRPPPRIPTLPPDLPITAHAAEIVEAIRNSQVVIVCGDTGSGKTTQLPKLALMAGRGRRGLIGCTQPRRLAAVSMARRVAEEFGEETGRTVGFQHRFDKRLSAATRIKFMTDGILLAETRHDRHFRAYDTLIIDEAHERSLNIDFLLGILKRTVARRRDLSLIISSATLDVERFSAFFGGAPIISVPGRLYPIETRWRPSDEEDDADLPRQIARAVDELSSEGRGDILVFLPGERDIREAAETLTGRRYPDTEIIPLLASLPAGEQQRAFTLSANRRIILSTNVAETSVTLPGIRYVIDSGLVRLNRYNPRTHVQRLQIEPISQASANQRKGRCGRIAPGICIRLYGEEDFKKRDAYTPPEILRSSLAGVILTMLDLKLGDIATFPLIDPPSAAMIREGYRELEQLGALEPVPPRADAAEETLPFRLSRMGHQLARLPLEPALGRVLFAADREGALADALILVAAMECDDPRRRPIEQKEEADRLHARFLSPVSDFAALLKLWRWYHEQTDRQSQSFARRLCKANFLSYPKMRDWSDLRDQLERMCKEELALDTASSHGGDAGLHRALLAGLIGNLGKRDPEANDYRGTRGIRFAIFPGSGLAKKKEQKVDPKQPRHGAAPLTREWVLTGELVETSRLFARTVACIDPAWIEPVAGHLCKYSYHSAAWDGQRGFVRVKERVTLFGLVLVEGRTRDDSRINPEEARGIFIREGLLRGDLPKPIPPAVLANLERIRALEAVEEKTRQHGQLFDPEIAFRFYDAHLPATVCNMSDLRKWLKQATPAEREALVMKASDLPPARDLSKAYPDAVVLNGNRLRLDYRHAPGERDDGVTCTVPVALLPQAAAWRSEWLVPGLLDEKVRWMLASLPTRLRRLLIPLDETLAMCRARMKPGQGSLAHALIDAVYAERGIRIPEESWEGKQPPDHLRMRFRVVDTDGKELGSGREITTLIRMFGDERPVAAPVSASTWHRDGLTRWDFGDLPARVDVGKAGWPIINYPALQDAQSSVSIRLFADAAVAAATHEKGCCRLFALALGKEWKRYSQPISLPRDALLYLTQLEMTPASLGLEIAEAALRETFTADRPPIRSAAAFAARFEQERGNLYRIHLERVRLVTALLRTAGEIEQSLSDTALPESLRDDIGEQLAWLIFPGFAAAIPGVRLNAFPRYLEACRIRIQRARNNPAGDQRKTEELAPFWRRYVAFATQDHPPRHNALALDAYRWLVEEYRVSLFAQELKTPVPVSPKRLTALWETVSRING